MSPERALGGPFWAMIASMIAGCHIADPPTVECVPPIERELTPAAALDPCADGRVILAVVSTRDAARPEVLEFPFETDGPGSACVEVSSPAEPGGIPAASAGVAVDGTELVDESAFRHAPTEARELVPLSVGDHALSIAHRSTPGSTVRVTVRFLGDGDVERAAASLAAVDVMEFAACNELNQTLEALPEDRRAALIDDLVALGFQPGSYGVATNAYGYPSYLGPLPTEGLVTPGMTPADSALAWLARHRDTLGIADAEIVFTAVRTADLRSGYRVELRASWRELRLEGAALTVLLDDTLEVRTVSGSVPPLVSVLSVPVVSAAEATRAAELATGGVASGLPTQRLLDLGVLQNEARTLLVWVVPTDAGTARVDAADGTVVHVTTPFEYDDPSGYDHIIAHDLPGADVDVRDDTTGTFAHRIERCSFTGGTPEENVRLTAECRTVNNALPLVDGFFRSLGRLGWSDTGSLSIEADAPYVVVFDAAAPGAWFSREGTVFRSHTGTLYDVHVTRAVDDADLFGVELRPAVALESRYTTESVLVHEWSHGLQDVEMAREADAALECEIQGIDEHVSDTFAIFENAYYGRTIDQQLVMRLRDGEVRRDHRSLVDYDANACVESPHVSALLHQRAASCFEHENSCVFTRLWALGREAAARGGGGIPYHGVDVDPIPLTEAKLLFYDIVTSNLSDTDNFATYGHDYFDAAAARAIACETAHTCPFPDFGETLGRPAWAVGLWTRPVELRLSSSVGPAAAVSDGSVWLFFAPSTEAGRIDVYRDADIFDGTRGVSESLASLGVTNLPRTSSDLASARTGDLVTLATIPIGGNRIVLASTTATNDATWRPTTTSVRVDGVREGVGGLAVHHAPALPLPIRSVPLVVAARRIGTASDLVFFTTQAPTPTHVPDSDGEDSPALVAGTGLETELWSFYRGGLVRRTAVVESDGTVGWSLRDIGVYPAVALSTDGLVVRQFLGRTQIFFPHSDGPLAHFSLPGGNPFFPFLPGPAWERRPAVFEVRAPSGMLAQFVIGFRTQPVFPSTSLTLTQRRSD